VLTNTHSGNLKRSNHLRDIGIVRKMILKWDLQLIKRDHAHHIDLNRDILQWRGNVDQVIEPFGNHKSSGRKFLESLSDF